MTPARRRRPGRALLVAGLLLTLLAGGAVAGWAYVRGQHYVGVDGDEVAVFRGVRGSVGALDLHSVTRRSGIDVDDLPAFQQRRVRQGIDAESPTDADRIVERLRSTVTSPTQTDPAQTDPAQTDPDQGTTDSAVTPTPPLDPTPSVSPGAAGFPGAQAPLAADQDGAGA